MTPSLEPRLVGEEAVTSPSFRQLRAPLLFIGLLLAAFLLYARVGSQTAARGDRVLSSLDPAAEWVKKSGGFLLSWLWRNADTVGNVVTGVALALGVVGVAVGRRRSVPLVLLLAGASLATWGQVSLWRGRLGPGVWLYVGGMVCAAAVGVLRPLRSLPGVPSLPPLTGPVQPEAPPPQTETRPMAATEWAALLFLTLLGLLLRGYTLTELPNFFDEETIGVLTGSYTGYGIREYMRTELLGTGNGVFHVLTHFVLYHLFGPSVFSIRLAALLWSVAAIPLLYWLVRRLAGTTAASTATLLFVAAPEQLYWGRSENSFFAPVMAVALVTAHLGLTMVQRFSPRAVLAAALWMPACRFSYTPSFVLFTFPLLLAGHAVAFVRGMWRKLRYVVPILALGVLLWILSLSVLEFALAREREWHFINPATVRGVAAWKQDVPPDAGLLEVVRLQAVRISRNVGHVLAGMTHHAKYVSHWYIRTHMSPDRNTSISAGLAVLSALGAGYLLGQIQDRRAALLLGWVAIGLLPGAMSDDPEARRISIIFPALPAIAGVFVAVAARLFREGSRREESELPEFPLLSSGRLVARVARVALVVAVALTALTSLASHLLIPVRPLSPDADIRFSRPLYERCNVVLHNLWYRAGHTVQLGNLDTLLRSGLPRCSQLVEEKDWPGAALDPRCDFSDGFFSYILSQEDRKARARALKPTRVGYLLRETPESRPHIDLLTRLYPSADRRELKASNPEDNLVAIEVPMAQIKGLRAPELTGTTMRGSLLLPADGWYRFRLQPGCAEATLAVAKRLEPAHTPRPLLAGLYPFETTLPPASCKLPFEVRAEDLRGAASGTAPLLLSPAAAEQAPALPVFAISGWGDATVFAKLPGQPADIGVDGKGAVYVLLRIGGAWEVHRFGKDGKVEGTFRTGLPVASEPSIAVDGEGTCVLSGASDVEIHDRSGRQLASWKVPYDQGPSDIALWCDGGILFCFPSRHTLQLFSRAGTPREILELRGGENPMKSPTGVAVTPDGKLLVVDEKGRAELFQSPIDNFAPKRVATFQVAYPEVPFVPDLKGCAFDGPDRLLFPHRSRSVPLVYNLEGQRVLATTPERDLSAKGLKEAHGFCATRDALYVLDSYPSAVIRVAR
jgi:hypothetical protein